MATTRRWGEQTQRAIENFPVSGERIPRSVIEALAMIKAECAIVNTELGVVTPAIGAAIRRAADEVVRGEMADQFPVDVFQTGSGTSTNMNLNEVIANRASELVGESVHPNDHVNASQSSNDTFPSAARIAAMVQLTTGLLPALDSLRRSLTDLSSAARRHREDGAHPPDGRRADDVRTGGQRVGAQHRAVDRSHHGDARAPRRAAPRRNRRRDGPECTRRFRIGWSPSD